MSQETRAPAGAPPPAPRSRRPAAIYSYASVFDVAARSRPYEKIAVAKDRVYVVEAVRAEGTSPWFAAGHDEFVVVMKGDVAVTFVELARNPIPVGKEGTIKLPGDPEGRTVGTIRLKRGCQALLPNGAAYQFLSLKPGLLLIQTLLGDLTVEKWAEIAAH